MKQKIAVKRMAELGHDTRMSLFRLLVKAGNNGLTVGEIGDHLNVSGSTLSHHISRLMHAGLIRQERDGRMLYCFAELDALREVLGFLEDECCTL